MKKTTRAIALFMILAILASLFTMAASAYSTVSYGSWGGDVKELQKMLNIVINAGLAEDSDFGNGTHNAVVAFQRSCGLDADGIVGPNTWNALVSKYNQLTTPTPTKPSTPSAPAASSSSPSTSIYIYFNSKPDDVIKLQKMLNEVTNAGLVEDGVFGNGTYNAVVAFQRSCGLDADGIVGTDTWNALLSRYTPSTTPSAPTPSNSNNISFSQTIYDIAHAQKGNDFRKYSTNSSDWCGHYVQWILENVCTKLNIDVYRCAPYAILYAATDAAEAYQNSNTYGYYGFTKWEWKSYSGYPTSNRFNYSPKPGDILLIETNGDKNDGPDHLGIIIKVNSDGSFISSEGNTGDNRIVSEHTYVYQNGCWRRSSWSNGIVHAIGSINLP